MEKCTENFCLNVVPSNCKFAICMGSGAKKNIRMLCYLVYPALIIALTDRRDEIATIIDADHEYIFRVHSVTPSVCLKLVYPTLTI